MIDHKLPKPANGDVSSSAWLPPERASKRRMLWEIGNSMQCSVLGTCLGGWLIQVNSLANGRAVSEPRGTIHLPARDAHWGREPS